ncbi:MAG: RNA pseudouridine synthase [Candidatus Muiribacterium halophilum]|uniref:Pseudouridine synthase n=1 Tax=Muiribacterium halophilum TaxID=2053465 RepID=A0A2N5Z9G4_MUIH1|nr:MAG: RNA pseudouridine synthase [Candidatus Muirbacterium halophilum]
MPDYKALHEIEHDFQRLDLYVAENLIHDLSRSKLQRLIKDGTIRVNGNKVKPNQKLIQGDIIEYDFEYKEPDKLNPAEVKGIEILYEDENIIVVNKPRGVVVHPAESVKDPTVVNHLIFLGVPLAPVSYERPGVVHRIDRFTSGIVVFVKDMKTYDGMVELFKLKKIQKKYIALCYNRFKTLQGIIDMPIGRSTKDRRKMSVKPGGKSAVTHFEVKAEYGDYSYLELFPKTGRTHQLRVHLAKVGHPIVGDDVYGPKTNEFGLTGQFLHAKEIVFIHPVSGKEIYIKAPMPPELMSILESIKDEK